MIELTGVKKILIDCRQFIAQNEVEKFYNSRISVHQPPRERRRSAPIIGRVAAPGNPGRGRISIGRDYGALAGTNAGFEYFASERQAFAALKLHPKRLI
jgi:hypothetical protein